MEQINDSTENMRLKDQIKKQETIISRQLEQINDSTENMTLKTQIEEQNKLMQKILRCFESQEQEIRGAYVELENQEAFVQNMIKSEHISMNLSQQDYNIKEEATRPNEEGVKIRERLNRLLAMNNEFKETMKICSRNFEKGTHEWSSSSEEVQRLQSELEKYKVENTNLNEVIKQMKNILGSSLSNYPVQKNFMPSEPLLTVKDEQIFHSSASKMRGFEPFNESDSGIIYIGEDDTIQIKISEDKLSNKCKNKDLDDSRKEKRRLKKSGGSEIMHTILILDQEPDFLGEGLRKKIKSEK